MKTRTVAAILALILVGTTSVSAQEATERNHSTDRNGGLALRAGLGIAGLGGNNLLDEVTLAWNIGLHYEWSFAPKWGLDIGAELSHKGGAITNSERWDDDSRTVMRLNYLQLPVVVTRHLRAGRVDLAPYAGLYYAWCASARLHT